MNNFKFLGAIDTTPILKELAAQEWRPDVEVRGYQQGPDGEVESIILRFQDTNVDDTHENIWKDISAHFPETKAIIHNIMRSVDGTRLGRVVINKINSGGRIYKHTDDLNQADYWSRFHISVHSQPGVNFFCGDELVQMRTGDIWYFRNDLEHEIINNTDEPRIHLVMDVKTNIEKPPKFPIKMPYEGVLNKIWKSGDVTYQVENIQTILEEMKLFVMPHWNEVGLNRDEIPVDMDWDRYIQLQNSGNLHILTARKKGELIGYHFTFVQGHFHYKSTLHGLVDLYYIKPEYRKGRTGLRLFQYAEESLKDLGVKKIFTGCKVKLDHTKLFEHLGYTKSDYQFTKVIKYE